MDNFLSMGGYGVYVWTAYGLSAAGVLGLAFAIWRRGRALRRRLDELDTARDRQKSDGNA